MQHMNEPIGIILIPKQKSKSNHVKKFYNIKLRIFKHSIIKLDIRFIKKYFMRLSKNNVLFIHIYIFFVLFFKIFFNHSKVNIIYLSSLITIISGKCILR